MATSMESVAPVATGEADGINDSVGWLWWPSSDDVEAIRHGFDGRSLVDGCFCCELCVKKVRYFVRTLTKKIRVRAAHFFQPLTT
jgi:hypothetical protein